MGPISIEEYEWLHMDKFAYLGSQFDDLGKMNSGRDEGRTEIL